MGYEDLRNKVVKILKSRGVIGGCLIFHGFRYNNVRLWYWSPHFHVLGFVLGGYSRCRNCKDKWNCMHDSQSSLRHVHCPRCGKIITHSP